MALTFGSTATGGGTTTEPARAAPDWLALREPADAAARATSLVEALRAGLPTSGSLFIHDLGCGTGAMLRWLAPRLAGPQHWVLHDRDCELLLRVAQHAVPRCHDATAVTAETRRDDITRLTKEELAGASLVTASALLDMMTSDGLHRLVARLTTAACPVLVTLSVTGRVDLDPAHALDVPVGGAFNADQQRTTAEGRLLGPDAVGEAAAAFTQHGFEVLRRPSPWRLGPDRPDLTSAWLTGWVGAACAQRPGLAAPGETYARLRLAQLRSGRLRVTVHHEDLLALPRTA